MASSAAAIQSRNQQEVERVLELSAQEVFRMMMSAELVRTDPITLQGPEFTAMVGLAGNICGLLSLRCGADGANLIAALMLHLPAKESAGHAWDALGEVANIVAGNFKSKLNGVSDACMLSLPTVVTGADYTFHSLSIANPITLWFTVQGTPLCVTLQLQAS